jgi:ABC-type multidrug transport system fused ATPase/permease subunit
VQFPLTQTLTMLEIVIVLVAGSFMVLAGDTTFGVVVAFMSYTALLATPLSDIANLTATTLNAAAGGRPRLCHHRRAADGQGCARGQRVCLPGRPRRLPGCGFQLRTGAQDSQAQHL